MRVSDFTDLVRSKGGGTDADWSTSDSWVTFGSRVLLGVLVAILGFGTLISINGAIISSGVVTVENNYKTVQHLDGGIVAEILVRNGDPVAAGDVLLRLDKTTDRAELTVVRERIDDLRIQRARLEAERDGRRSFEIPNGTTMSEGIQKTIATQRALFNARMETQRGEVSVLTRRIEQVTAQLRGLAAQQRARARERALMAKDLAGVRELFAKGFANQQRLTQLERDAARLDGEVGRLSGEIARAEGALSETELNLTQRKKTFIEGVIDELRRVQTQLNELEERRKALDAKVARAVVRAPEAGRVHALAIHTEGGVITPARPILQIIPQNERMVVEARIQPRDIDNITTGQQANIRFPAFNARVTPRLYGAVTRVSAAELEGEQGSGSYYTAQIEIPPDEMAKIGNQQRLLPGMPAEVYITTEARSILSYFLRPLTDAMFRAFREE
ncbi:MAG: HlyD family type I secretion periplasmic adaptor subunit [Pseudomonadota bacterium]